MDKSILEKAKRLEQCINLSSGIGKRFNGELSFSNIEKLSDLDRRFAKEIDSLVDKYHIIWVEELEKL